MPDNLLAENLFLEALHLTLQSYVFAIELLVLRSLQGFLQQEYALQRYNRSAEHLQLTQTRLEWMQFRELLMTHRDKVGICFLYDRNVADLRSILLCSTSADTSAVYIIKSGGLAVQSSSIAGRLRWRRACMASVQALQPTPQIKG